MTEPGFIIAGAGHNSLVAAAYLARAGLRVLVLGAVPTHAVIGAAPSRPGSSGLATGPSRGHYPTGRQHRSRPHSGGGWGHAGHAGMRGVVPPLGRRMGT
jgi:choline dehydrogenase-like flavoprotein